MGTAAAAISSADRYCTPIFCTCIIPAVLSKIGHLSSFTNPDSFPISLYRGTRQAILTVGRDCRYIKSVTSLQQVVVMEFGKRLDTTHLNRDNAPTCSVVTESVAMQGSDGETGAIWSLNLALTQRVCRLTAGYKKKA